MAHNTPAEASASAVQDKAEAETPRSNDQYKRALADLDNYRKRFDRELVRLRDHERETILRDILPIADSLDRALAVPTYDSLESWSTGTEALRRQLLSILKRYGVEPVEDAGQAFDPIWHEVLATSPSDQLEGTILDVAERGYRIDDRPLRPARVVVAKLEGEHGPK